MARAISWREQVNFQWDDDEIRFVLDQHAELDFGGVKVSVLDSTVVDRGFEPRSSQTKDYKNGIFFFSANYAALRRKKKGWLARNQDNVTVWSDMKISINIYCLF
jgi:hypothetical protein